MIGETIKSADWKAEKHVPVIEAPDKVEAGKPFEVRVTVGKEIPHPNTLEHHIKWIDLYFQPQGDQFAYQVGHVEFSAHGEAETVTAPVAVFSLRLGKPGKLIALSLCNIHGLWESSSEVMVV